MGLDDSGTLAALKAHRRELIDPKISEYDGRIVKTTGDGLLLEFPSVVDAVRCAVDVQRGMAERNAGTTPDQRLDFRIGINVGDIIIDGDDIYGDGVNVAARLEGLAEPGGICASRVVRDQVLDKLSFTFEDLGPQQVKNIARPVDVYRVHLGSEAPLKPGAPGAHSRRVTHTRAWRWFAATVLALGIAGIAIWAMPPFWNSAAPALPPLSIAILPFTAPASSVVEKEYAEALRHDLTTGLAAVRRDMKTVQSDVTADGAANSRELGRRLNVRYVVEGDVRRDRAGHIVNLRVVDVHAGTQLWGQRYDLPDSATPAESSVKLRKIVGQLANTVSEAETRRVIAQPLDQLNAIELVLRGDAVLGNSWTLTSTKDARALYDAALRLDPNLATALVARSDILDAELDVDPSPDRDRIVREMEALSSRALQLDVSNPQVWRARGQALGVAGRWNAALEAIDQAIRLDPYNPHFPIYKAWMMIMSGRPADALSIIDQAMAMEPIYVGWGMMMACWAHLLLGQVDHAVARCEKAAPLEPNYLVQLLLAAAYADRGDLGRAVAAKERVLRTQPGYTVSQLRAKRYSEDPGYLKLAETYWYPGLLKAGFPEH